MQHFFTFIVKKIKSYFKSLSKTNRAQYRYQKSMKGIYDVEIFADAFRKNIIGGDILITAPYYDECGNEGLEIKEFIKNSRI